MDLLLVEDDLRLGKALDRGLCENGYSCTWIRNGRKGLECASAQKYDAVILDLMLPDLHGLELISALRRAGIQTPVLVLTALGSVDDRVLGLKTGADDYLVKPFAFPELLARVEALGRRSGARPAPVLETGALRLDLSSRRVSRNGVDIELSPTEFSILEFLMRHSGQVVTRKMLSEHLWDEDWNGVTNAIDVHMTRLRSKIDRGFEEPLIHTVRGRGYALRTN